VKDGEANKAPRLRLEDEFCASVRRYQEGVPMTRVRSIVGSAVLMASIICIDARAQCGAINTGGGNCTPPTAPGMPGYSETSAGQSNDSGTTYVTQWGAIAIDKVAASAGAVTGKMSESEARRDALAECAAKGGKECRISIAYDNQCAAVAWSPGMYFSASKVDRDDARARALALCSAEKESCQVVYSGCSLPVAKSR
jgi:hypothetical protein